MFLFVPIIFTGILTQHSERWSLTSLLLTASNDDNEIKTNSTLPPQTGSIKWALLPSCSRSTEVLHPIFPLLLKRHAGWFCIKELSPLPDQSLFYCLDGRCQSCSHTIFTLLSQKIFMWKLRFYNTSDVAYAAARSSLSRELSTAHPWHLCVDKLFSPGVSLTVVCKCLVA